MPFILTFNLHLTFFGLSKHDPFHMVRVAGSSVIFNNLFLLSNILVKIRAMVLHILISIISNSIDLN